MNKVVIYKPAKNAMQSGTAKSREWIMEFSAPNARYKEAMVGWAADCDTLSQVKLTFPDQQAAIDYAILNNLDYQVLSADNPVIKGKSYADNFKHSKVKYYH